MANEPWTLYFDGACQPCNPGGVATYGWVLLRPDGNTYGMGCGVEAENSTNNVAEFSALEHGLHYVRSQSIEGPLMIMGDSLLVIRAILDRVSLRAPHLISYREAIWRLLKRRKHPWDAHWIPREENGQADAMSEMAYSDHCQDRGITKVWKEWSPRKKKIKRFSRMRRMSKSIGADSRVCPKGS